VKHKVDQSSFSETKIPLSSRPLYGDYYNIDREVIYVCGGNNFDKKCTCINETLSCNQGYYSYFSAGALKHNKIKICDDNFIVKFVDFCHNNIVAIEKYLPKLKSLNLKFNQKINLSFQTNGINVTIFSPALSNLEFLNLASCNIQTFDDMVFVNFR
uniref:Uncharacterized protein n=1 Tax=Panagrolaimus sp. PS1159 TaxID=55785 RepID=A0AC35GAN6_9BILA